VSYVYGGAGLVVFVFVIVLIGRFVFTSIMFFAPEWKPRGLALILTEVCFSVTDPPIKFLRRFIPSPTVGHTRLDLASMVLFIVCVYAYNALLLARNG